MATKEERKREAEQLGCSKTSGTYRIMRGLLFEFADALDIAHCVRCECPIESVDDMSIEHIEDWHDKPNAKELFFDLGNLAFSHKHCNSDRDWETTGPA